jgi:excinuclease ABC subunit C
VALDLVNVIRHLPGSPGVYRLLDAKGEVMYVGKARNLRKRVGSYFNRRGLTAKVLAMTRATEAVEVTVTNTESEALLLESNLIKSLHPRFNIQLRDDKSYPYIYVSDKETFPRLAFHRGSRRESGRYFGPYPSASAVRESLNLLQKIFPVRQCENTFFLNRSRPCLQYQIKRCTAPCVGLIDHERYSDDVRHAILFLEGRSQTVIEETVRRMEDASTRHEYELAALYRDRIAALKRVQERQYVTKEGGDADVLAVATDGEIACVEVVFIRGGRNLGSKSFFPRFSVENKPAEILAAFLPQYYLGKAVPPQIYLCETVPDMALIEQVMSEQAGNRTRLQKPARGAARRWVGLAALNAKDALRRLKLTRTSLALRLEALREALALDSAPERIECFDISHTFGEAAVAACVVFDANGPIKSDYRRFNIEGIKPGDDYGAMRQALERRYRRVKEGEGKLPDLLLIDGGKGQVAQALTVLEELQLAGVKVVGVAKGEERKPGKEQLFLSASGEPSILPADSPALHLIQQVRDEAHRFAITAHRQRRAKVRTTSSLERIPGIGDRRRQALLKNFGGLREVARAGVEDLARVPGISRELAQRIYDVFHEGS